MSIPIIEHTEPLKDKKQTADRIRKLITLYSDDLDICFVDKNGEMIPLSALTLEDFFDYVRRIPYRMDKRPVEVVARPFHIIDNADCGMDCKKKAILMGAWAKKNGIRSRFIASSKRADRKVHHIFPQFFLSGEWLNVDATYPEYHIFQGKRVTHSEIV